MTEPLDERWVREIIQATTGLGTVVKQVVDILEMLNGKDGIILQLQILGTKVEQIQAGNSSHIKEELLRLRAENLELRAKKDFVTEDMKGKWGVRDTAVKGLIAIISAALGLLSSWLLAKP